MGCRAPKNPSLEFLQNIQRQGCDFVEKILVKELKFKLQKALLKTGVQVEVRAGFLADTQKAQPIRDIYVEYPCLYGGIHNPKGIIKIRCSFLGIVLCQVSSIQQDLLSYYTGPQTVQAAGTGFKVRSVSAMQCLLEKMLLLHELYRIEEPASYKIIGTARHLYDIVQLFELVSTTTDRMDQNLLNRLRRHRNEWLKISTTSFRGCSFKKLCFIPPLNLLGPLMDDYRKLRKEVIFDQQWDFPVLVGKIQQINQWFNGIQWPRLKDCSQHSESERPLTGNGLSKHLTDVVQTAI